MRSWWDTLQCTKSVLEWPVSSFCSSCSPSKLTAAKAAEHTFIMGEYLFDCLFSTSLYSFALPTLQLGIVLGKIKPKTKVDFAGFVRNNAVK